MLRKVVAAWAVGLGLSAVGLVPSAMPAEQAPSATKADVDRLGDDIKEQTAAIRELIARLSPRHEDRVYSHHEREHHRRSPYPRRIAHMHRRYDPYYPPCPEW
jgi:hypothetical protein